MLAHTDTPRVIPLLQQDAYMDSLRSDYNHYVNTLLISIDNPLDVDYFHVLIEFTSST